MINTLTESPYELLLIAAICVLMGAVIICGRGDWLIDGYNTASPAYKARMNKKRMRALVASILWMAALLVGGVAWCADMPSVTAMLTAAFIIYVIVAIVLVNTWATKK